MKIVLRIIGNSKGVVIQSPPLRELNINFGDQLAAAAGKPRYTLEELLAQCDPSAPMTAEMIEWDSMRPVGKEI